MTSIKNETSAEPRNQIPSSLRFPKLDLNTCLGKIKILFTQNSTNTMSPGAMAADLGYSDGSGSVDSVLASLKYYGLLELATSGRYKVGDAIINYCLDNPLTREDTRHCLFSVPVNKKLFSTYDFDNLPGDNEIKSFLIKECKYSLKEATTYIETFKSNQSVYNEFKVNPGLPEQVVKQEAPLQSNLSPASLAHISEVAPVLSSNMYTYSHPLSQGRYITIQLPKNINELDGNDLADAKDLLVLVAGKIERWAQQLQEQGAQLQHTQQSEKSWPILENTMP